MENQNDSQEKKLIHKILSVGEFHEAFLIGNRTEPTGTVPENEYMLRYNLLKEENEEYLEACKRGDVVEIADALGDILYIAFGTILRHGLQDRIEDIFDEIHRSNMSKLDKDGKPVFREDGKVMKSELYFRPDIRKYLEGYVD